MHRAGPRENLSSPDRFRLTDAGEREYNWPRRKEGMTPFLSYNEAKRKLADILQQVSRGEGPLFVTDKSGDARAVILGLDTYHAMMDALEDQSEMVDFEDYFVKAIIAGSKKKHH